MAEGMYAVNSSVPDYAGRNGSNTIGDPGLYPATCRFTGRTSGDGSRKSGIMDRGICSGQRRSAGKKCCLHLNQFHDLPHERNSVHRNPIPPLSKLYHSLLSFPGVNLPGDAKNHAGFFRNHVGQAEFRAFSAVFRQWPGEENCRPDYSITIAGIVPYPDLVSGVKKHPGTGNRDGICRNRAGKGSIRGKRSPLRTRITVSLRGYVEKRSPGSVHHHTLTTRSDLQSGQIEHCFPVKPQPIRQ